MTICSKYPKELTHYDKQLKKKCFGKLKENVWESKTKWQLMLKAQRNYHHKLLLTSFSAWSIFTACKLRKMEKVEKADEHFLRKFKRKVFTTLKRRVERRWALNKKLATLRNFKIQKRAWKFWRRYVKKSQRSKEIYALTEKLREMYLVRNYIELWFVNYTEKNFTEMKYLRAIIHYNFTLKRRTFIEWMNYQNRKNFKRKHISHFTAQIELKQKQKIFTTFMQYTQHKKLYEKHVNCVTLFYETYLVRSVIDKWFVKYDDLVESRNRDNYVLAVKFYDENLLGRSFRKLKVWSDDQKSRNDASNLFVCIKIKLYLDLWRKYHRERLLTSSLEEKADKWRNHQLKMIYLTKMMEAFDERRNENHQIENFMRFCDGRLLRESFRKMQQFLFYKKQKKLKSHLAQHYYDGRITQKSYRLLQTHAMRRIRKTSIVNYRNRRLLHKSFDKLLNYSRIKRNHRDCINKFQERRKLQTLRRAFSVLYDKTKNNRLKHYIAREIAEGNIKKKTFQLWKKFHETKVEKNMVIHNSRLILQDVIIRNVLAQWCKKSQIRTMFKQELSKVKSNRERRLVKNYLQKWLNIIDKFRVLRENLKMFSRLYSETIVEYYLLKMIDVWNGRRAVKEKIDLALRAEKILLMRRYYNRWVTYISWKKEKLRECSARIFLPMQLQKCREFSKAKLRRKQPMIPLYLREELLPLQENAYLDGFSSNDNCDVRSPVSENLPVMY